MRGVALCGILAMNIVGFAMPEAAYVNPAVWGHAALSDKLVWAVSFVAIDGKMRALFAILFGASTALIVDRADAAGQNAARIHFPRMAVLLGIGLIHYIFIWYGDILTLYALSGCILYWMLRLAPEKIASLAMICLLFAGLIGGIDAMAMSAARDGGVLTADMASLAKGVADSFSPNPARSGTEILLHTGPWSAMIGWRLDDFWVSGPVAQFEGGVVEALGQMLLGVWLLRSGLFSGEWPRERLARWGWTLVLSGWAALALLAAAVWASGFETMRVFAIVLGWAMPFAQLVAFGYALLLVRWAGSPGLAWLKQRLAATGQVALSNYIGCSIAMVLLFDFGGSFGSWNRTELLLPLLLTIVAMLAWPRPWLSRFRFGPLEWLWRSAARGGWQRMRGPAAE